MHDPRFLTKKGNASSPKHQKFKLLHEVLGAEINCCVGVVSACVCACVWTVRFFYQKINSAVILEDGTRLSVRCEIT